MKIQTKNKNRLNYYQNRGFTLLEMLLVIGIFGILTSVVIFNYGNFNKNVIMSNLAYEVALEIRQAQVFSLGTRASGDNSGDGVRDAFDTRYGVYFNTGQSGGDRSFVSFADFYPVNNNVTDDSGIKVVSGDNRCDGDTGGTSYLPCSVSSCTGECRQISTLTLGISIDKLCISNAADDPVNLETGECNDSEIDDLAITFARPYTDAFMTTDDPVFAEVPIEGPYNAGIVMKSTAGSQRAVIVKSTGQISVEFINNQ
ncbi:MAG TPA: type II secretion system protein [Candidatus Paceibacterota bacterium]|nr:type II secretion system protein [Candidatus Paceibacterota bacterium]